MTNLKKCKSCGERFKPKYSSLEKFCTEKEQCRNAAFNYAMDKKKEAEKRKLRKDRENFNWTDSKWLKSNLQSEVNKIVRSIDRGLTCLATDTSGQIQAGHIYSRGAHTQMRYNFHNIHRQSAYSNNKQSHDGLMQERLSEEYGDDYLAFIRDMRSLEVQKWTIAQLGTALKIARMEFRSLEKEETKLFSKERRITLRNQMNLKLGLYSPQISIYQL